METVLHYIDDKQSRLILIVWAPSPLRIKKLAKVNEQVAREVLTMKWQSSSFTLLGKVRDEGRVCGYQRICYGDVLGPSCRKNFVLDEDEQMVALRFGLSFVLELNDEDERKQNAIEAERNDGWETNSEWSREV